MSEKQILDDNYSEESNVFLKKAKQLTTVLKSSGKTVVFTGAGVSTLSGIPDFRGKHGVYSDPWMGMNVEDIISLSFFRKNPSVFYKWAKDVWYRLDEYEPNIAHKVLHLMEQKGIVHSIYTQNIDMLHQRAGSVSVGEIHGSPLRHHCTKCGKEYKYDFVAPLVRSGEVPYCSSCHGVIKPDIIFYEEQLNGELLSRAYEDFNSCDVCMVVGSSLLVQPAASMPVYSLNHGAKLVIVNASPTSLDDYAYLHFNDIRQVFTYLEENC